MTATAPEEPSDALVIGLVGLAHLMSHFYQIALAPLFPLLRAEFEVSYTALGLIVSLFFAVSGIVQAFVGILVDRYGADRLLLFGMTTMATAVLLMGLVPAYWMLLPLAAVAAVGNSVFHPADLSILSAKIDPRRIGRAFAIHGFGGTCGYFLSPVVIYYGVASFAGWRAGIMVAGGLGLVAALVMYRYRAALHVPASARASSDDATPTLVFYGRLATNLPLISAFCFFVVTAAALIGIQNFSVTALVELYDPPLYLATAGLTAYLGGHAIGIIGGGELADRYPRHVLIAAGGLALGAILMACVGLFSLPMPAIIALLAASGICLGATNPSRDILVRDAAPPGATGKVFGFVYSGLDLGGAVAPLLFGWLLDGGQVREVFLVIAAMYLIGIVSVLQIKSSGQALPAEAD